MAVSQRDKQRMRRLVEDLARSETTAPGSAAQRAARLGWINARRAEIGMPPLTDEAPEEGLIRRARALGMARIDR